MRIAKYGKGERDSVCLELLPYGFIGFRRGKNLKQERLNQTYMRTDSEKRVVGWKCHFLISSCDSEVGELKRMARYSSFEVGIRVGAFVQIFKVWQLSKE